MALTRDFNWLKLAWVVSLCASVSCCKVGPNFHPPAPPTTRKYTARPQPKKTVRTAAAGMPGRAQYLINGRDILGEWWTLFRSKRLNRFIEEGLRSNPNLAATKAALIEARELLHAQIGESYYPNVGLQLNANRNKVSALSIGLPASSTFSLYTAKVQATYLLDFFGKERRLVESFRARVDYDRYEMLAAYLSLTSNIVTNYINIASLQAQIETTLQIISDQKKILTLVTQQYQVGGASKIAVIAQETLLAQTKATLPPLRKSLSSTQHALAILLGKFPSELTPKDYKLNALQLPAQLPLSIPSNLVRQRPDIQASQALLHKASAEVGVATANLYPQITLAGDFGWISTVLSGFFSSTNSIWTYGAQLLQPIFKGGALRAKKRAAIAAFQQSFAQYHETVLEAFKEVANVLRAIDEDAKEFSAQYEAEATAKETLDITLNQFRVGGTSYLEVLNAEQKYENTKLARIKAQAARYTDTAALFQALGGGWWNNSINTTSLQVAGIQKEGAAHKNGLPPPQYTRRRRVKRTRRTHAFTQRRKAKRTWRTHTLTQRRKTKRTREIHTLAQPRKTKPTRGTHSITPRRKAKRTQEIHALPQPRKTKPIRGTHSITQKRKAKHTQRAHTITQKRKGKLARGTHSITQQRKTKHAQRTHTITQRRKTKRIQGARA